MHRLVLRYLVAGGLLLLALSGLAGPARAAQSAAQPASATARTDVTLDLAQSGVGGLAGHRNPRTPIAFVLDDGTQETVFGLNTNYHGIPLIAINRFTPNASDFPFTLTQISIQFPDPTNANGDLTGRNIDLLVYEDPTGSADPTNASKVYQQTFQIQVADGVTFSNYPVHIVLQGPGDVYIGFSNTYDHGNNQWYTYPVPIDRGQSQLRSWIASNVNGSDPNYNDLANNVMLSLIDNIGGFLGGNFVIHATGETGVVATPTPPAPTNTPPPAATPTRTATIMPTPTWVNQATVPPTPAPDPEMNILNYVRSQHPTWQCSGPTGWPHHWSIADCQVGGAGHAAGGSVDFYGDPNTAQANWVSRRANAQSTYPIFYDRAFGGYPGYYAADNNFPYAHDEQYFWGLAWVMGATGQDDTSYRYSVYVAEAILQAAQTLGYLPILTPTPTGTVTPTPTPVVPTVTPCPIQFSDVDANNPFYSFVRTLACRGIVGGYSDGTYRPGALVTRGQMAKFIANAAGYADVIPPMQQTFRDVPPTQPFWLFVERVAAHGVVSGYGCGGAGEPCPGVCFRPTNSVTRGQTAKFVAVAAGYQDPIAPTEQTFADVPPAQPFWLFVERAALHGVISGYGCGGVGEPCPGVYFRPGANVTRGQTAKFIANAFYPAGLGLKILAAGPPPVATRSVPQAPRAVLYDQYDHTGYNATNSQNYEPSMYTYSDLCADDVVVPSGQTWTIDEVDVAGMYSGGNGPVDSFNVALYTDAGVPGTQVYTATNLSYLTPIGSEFDIPLPVPAVVGPGTYWVMVQANLGWFVGGNRGQWLWYNRTVQSNNSAAWFNPGNGWGTSCYEDTGWGRRWVCQGDVSAPDQVFRVLGTLGAGATDTPGPSPTNTPPLPTNTPLPSPTNTPPFQPSPTPFPTHTPLPTSTLPPVATNTPRPATPTPLVTVTPCAISFSDVGPTSPFYSFVRTLVCHGIVGGYSDGTYRPGALVTRGQMAKFIANAAGYGDVIPATQQTFRDVPPTQPFWLFVERAAAHGVVSGYGCGGAGEPCPGVYFRPANSVTRGQTAKFVAVAAGYADTIPPAQQTFRDVPPTQPFWLFVERGALHGVISGYGCGGAGEPCPGVYFRPGANVTRGQTAKFIANAFYPAGLSR